jgi:hypothetical protein
MPLKHQAFVPLLTQKTPTLLKLHVSNGYRKNFWTMLWHERGRNLCLKTVPQSRVKILQIG